MNIIVKSFEAKSQQCDHHIQTWKDMAGNLCVYLFLIGNAMIFCQGK